MLAEVPPFGVFEMDMAFGVVTMMPDSDEVIHVGVGPDIKVDPESAIKGKVDISGRDGVAMGTKRGPGIIRAGGNPVDMGRGEDITRIPDPAVITVMVPAPVMKGDVAERVPRDPHPAGPGVPGPMAHGVRPPADRNIGPPVINPADQDPFSVAAQFILPDKGLFQPFIGAVVVKPVVPVSVIALESVFGNRVEIPGESGFGA